MSRPSRSAPSSSRRARRGWHVFRRPLLARPLVVLLLAACDPRAGHGRGAHAAGDLAGDGAMPPVAEFLLAGTDSSFWVRTGPDAGPSGMEVRRAPLVLGRAGGRWHELYVLEEDHSFHDAVFVAQALWRRDLVTGDSAVVFGDGLVPRLAAEYARAHPEELPLEPDEPEAEEPSIVATGELSLLDLQGGYASIEHFSDVHLPRLAERHEIRRTVVELGSGRELRLTALLGDDAAADVARRGRAAFVAARDSARRVARAMDAAAAAALDRFTFDARSFALTQVADLPGVVFYAVGHGDAAEGFALPLAPIAVAGGAWWDSARAELPLADAAAAGARDVGASAAPVSRHWRRGALTVSARPVDHPADARTDDGGSSSDLDDATPQRLSLRDSAGREWVIGSIGSPVRRLFWLGAGDVTDAERRALARAFYESAFHDGTLRAASRRTAPRIGPRVAPPLLRLATAPQSPVSVASSRDRPSAARQVVRHPVPRPGSPVPSR